MVLQIHCLDCGATVLEPVGPCPGCGGEIELSIRLAGVQAQCAAGNLGTVADSPTGLGGREIKYAAPTGSISKTSLNGSALTVQVKRPIDIGRLGEPRVLACIVACLARAGKVATFLPANDHAGEDGVLQIDGDRVVVQIVTGGPSKSFWNKAAKGGAEILTDLTGAANWIHAAISKKAEIYSPKSKRSMLLAVDIAHIGLLAVPALCEEYERLHGDPSLPLGFGAVWLVGPTENHVITLGNSHW